MKKSVLPSSPPQNTPGLLVFQDLPKADLLGTQNSNGSLTSRENNNVFVLKVHPRIPIFLQRSKLAAL